MEKKTIIKCIGMNIGIALIDVVIFSPGLLNFHLLKGSALERAIAGTALIMTFILVLFGNYTFLFQSNKPEKIEVKALTTPTEYIEALNRNQLKRTLVPYIETATNQIPLFIKKKVHIKEVLADRFDETEMSYIKFIQTIDAVEQLFFTNMKEIINKMNIYDENDITENNIDYIEGGNELTEEKEDIYKAYITFIKDEIKENEKLLLKIDKLLLELSKINLVGEINELDVVQELDELIQNTQHYK